MPKSPTVPVIDLTNSFTLVNHAIMANDIIELDDSINMSNPIPDNFVSPMPNTRHRRTEDNVVDLCQTPTNHIPDIVPASITPARRRRKNSKTAKIKIEPPKQINTTNEEKVRERSPLRNDFCDCPICYERLGVNPLVSTKCGHVFCEQCLANAIRKVKKCPTCRRSLRGNSAFHPLYLN